MEIPVMTGHLKSSFAKLKILLTGHGLDRSTDPILHTLVRREPGNRHQLIMGSICYVSILCLIPLITNKEDRFINFHARQGLVLWIWTVLIIMLLKIPGLGGIIFTISIFFIGLFSLAGIATVVLNQGWKLPFINILARKL